MVWIDDSDVDVRRIWFRSGSDWLSEQVESTGLRQDSILNSNATRLRLPWCIDFKLMQTVSSSTIG